MFFCNSTDLFDWLQSADFIVCCHYRDQDGLRCDSLLQLIQIYNTIFIHIQICDLCTLFFQPFTGMQDGMMLDFGCDDMVSF